MFPFLRPVGFGLDNGGEFLDIDVFAYPPRGLASHLHDRAGDGFGAVDPYGVGGRLGGS